jgi:hypothetical protein
VFDCIEIDKPINNNFRFNKNIERIFKRFGNKVYTVI